MAHKLGLGMTIAYDVSGSYTTVGEVIDIQMPGLSIDTVDATDHSHTDGIRRKIAGLGEWGEATFTIAYDPALAVYGTLATFAESRGSRLWRIQHAGTPTGSTTTFGAIITNIQPETPLDDRMTCQITLTPTATQTRS